MTAGGAAVPRDRQLREFVTPEGIDLRLRVGTGGERAGAFMFDVLFLLLTMFLCFVALLLTAIGLASLGETGLRDGIGNVMLVVGFLGFFALRNGYFILFELSGRAATPGKRIMGLRVAARDGGRLTAEAVFARNAMREIEIFLPINILLISLTGATDPVGAGTVLLGLLWSSAFILFPLFNRDRLRVGDFVAGTWVVKSPRDRLTIDLLDAMESVQGQFAFTPDQAGAYGIKELHVLEDVLRRRDRKTMTAVADRIRGKIVWRPREGETDAAFLSAYYAALRGRLETRLLFGHRRVDKFDTT